MTQKLDAAWLEARAAANAAYEKKDALGMLEAETLAEMLSMKARFVRDALTLATRLQHAADRVENAPLDHYTLNSAGELQGNAGDVDRLCAEIGTLRQVLAGIGTARNAAAK